MKIGLVLPSIPGYSETFFRNKIMGLQQHGLEVVLFVDHRQGTSSSCKVHHAPVLNGNKFIVVFNSLKALLKVALFYPKRTLKFYRLEKNDKQPFIQIVKHLIANQFILSETVDWLHFGFGTMALGRENVAQAMQAKMAVSFRGFDIGIYPVKHSNCYDLVFKKVNKIHVISDDLAQMVLDLGFKNDHQIAKITPAIETSFFTPIAKVEHTTFQVTTIARLHWKKGLEYTLKALALLKNDHVKFHYTLIGDGIEKERLQFAAYQLGLSDHVTFTGLLSPEAVKQQLQNTDIYVQYSIQEGFCNAVLEAQAMGLLCVVSDAEGLSENVLDGITGWVVPKRNPKLLAEKIQHVIALDSEFKKTISQNAQKRVKEQFNLQKQQQAFLEFYE